MTRESSREITALFILLLSAFLVVCLYTEPPAVTAPSAEVSTRNAGGPVGSAVNTWMLQWIGKVGAYGATSMIALTGIVLFFRRRIRQWGWKVTGGVLGLLAMCVFEAAVFNESGGPRHVPGGYLGFFLFDFLFSNVSTFGTYLLLALVLFVAFVIATDTAFYPAFAHAQRVVTNGERWAAIAAGVRDVTSRIALRGGKSGGGFALPAFLRPMTEKKKKRKRK